MRMRDRSSARQRNCVVYIAVDGVVDDGVDGVGNNVYAGAGVDRG